MIKKKGVFFPGQEKMCLFSEGGEENVLMVIFKIRQKKVEYAFVLYHYLIQNYKVIYMFLVFKPII